MFRRYARWGGVGYRGLSPMNTRLFNRSYLRGYPGYGGYAGYGPVGVTTLLAAALII